MFAGSRLGLALLLRRQVVGQTGQAAQTQDVISNGRGSVDQIDDNTQMYAISPSYDFTWSILHVVRLIN
jgi:hypothetical protein